MRWPALTDEQIALERQPLTEGEYSFEVVEAKDKISQKGNEMIELQLKIYANNNREYTLYDYLMGTPKTVWKLKNFFTSIGIADKYKDEVIDPFHLVGKHGKAKIVIKDGKDKNDNPIKKAFVDDYVVKIQQHDDLNDDIPF